MRFLLIFLVTATASHQRNADASLVWESDAITNNSKTASPYECENDNDCITVGWEPPYPTCASNKRCQCPECAHRTWSSRSTWSYFCGECGVMGASCSSDSECPYICSGQYCMCKKGTIYYDMCMVSDVQSSVSTENIILTLVLFLIIILYKLVSSGRVRRRMCRLVDRCRRMRHRDSMISPYIGEDGQYRNPRSDEKSASYTIGNNEFISSSSDPDMDWALELSRQLQEQTDTTRASRAQRSNSSSIRSSNRSISISIRSIGSNGFTNRSQINRSSNRSSNSNRSINNSSNSHVNRGHSSRSNNSNGNINTHYSNRNSGNRSSSSSSNNSNINGQISNNINGRSNNTNSRNISRSRSNNNDNNNNRNHNSSSSNDRNNNRSSHNSESNSSNLNRNDNNSNSNFSHSSNRQNQQSDAYNKRTRRHERTIDHVHTENRMSTVELSENRTVTIKDTVLGKSSPAEVVDVLQSPPPMGQNKTTSNLFELTKEFPGSSSNDDRIRRYFTSNGERNSGKTKTEMEQESDLNVSYKSPEQVRKGDCSSCSTGEDVSLRAIIPSENTSSEDIIPNSIKYDGKIINKSRESKFEINDASSGGEVQTILKKFEENNPSVNNVKYEENFSSTKKRTGINAKTTQNHNDSSHVSDKSLLKTHRNSFKSGNESLKRNGELSSEIVNKFPNTEDTRRLSTLESPNGSRKLSQNSHLQDDDCNSGTINRPGKQIILVPKTTTYKLNLQEYAQQSIN